MKANKERAPPKGAFILPSPVGRLVGKQLSRHLDKSSPEQSPRGRIEQMFYKRVFVLPLTDSRVYGKMYLSMKQEQKNEP